MAKVQKVEDLIAWQKAEALAELVYSACRSGELARAARLKLIPPAVFGPTYSLADETGKVSSGLISSLTQKRENLATNH